MKPTKILYVDDEAMALKYFERLVSPLAPVLTANSVEAGRAVLREHGADIAVLVCDQRMPGEQGNALLRHTREYYPGIVRMLTTAYSELGDAIEAINTGEIYRYINKPWELESLRADLKNALELADLRSERDALMRDKLLAQQGQLLAQRLARWRCWAQPCTSSPPMPRCTGLRTPRWPVAAASPRCPGSAGTMPICCKPRRAVAPRWPRSCGTG